MQDTISADGYGIYLNDLRTFDTDDEMYPTQLNKLDGFCYMTTDPEIAKAFERIIDNELDSSIIELIDDANDKFASYHIELNAAIMPERSYIYVPSIMPYDINADFHTIDEMNTVLFEVLEYVTWQAYLELHPELMDSGVELPMAEHQFKQRFKQTVDRKNVIAIIDDIHDGEAC